MRATDLSVRESRERVTHVKQIRTPEALTLETSGTSTGQISALPATVQFDQAIAKRLDSSDRWPETLLTVPDNDGIMRVEANFIAEVSWCVEAQEDSSTEKTLWRSILELSEDDGAAWALVTNGVTAYNGHANQDVCMVSPPRKLQLLKGDLLRVRVSVVTTDALSSDNWTISAECFFHIRTI